jgi:hypothetical protein
LFEEEGGSPLKLFISRISDQNDGLFSIIFIFNGQEGRKKKRSRIRRKIMGVLC